MKGLKEETCVTTGLLSHNLLDFYSEMCNVVVLLHTKPHGQSSHKGSSK